MQPLNACLIQTSTHWHDAPANRAMFDNWFEKVPEQAQLVVLPEMFASGFTMASAAVAETMDGPTVNWMIESAQALSKTRCGSLVIREGAEYFNRFLWVQPDGSLDIYDKRHRFRMAGEHEHYAAGDRRVVCALGDWRVCLMVCYDLRFPVWFRNRNDYDALVCVANWPAARRDAWNALLKARAIENQAYMLGCNIVGVDGNDVAYSGGSGVYAPDGAVVAEAFDDAELVNVTLSGDALVAQRKQFPVWQDADEFEVKDMQ